MRARSNIWCRPREGANCFQSYHDFNAFMAFTTAQHRQSKSASQTAITGTIDLDDVHGYDYLIRRLMRFNNNALPTT